MKGAEHIRRAKSVMDYICDRIDVSANRRHISELVEWVITADDFRRLRKHMLLSVPCCELSATNALRLLVTSRWIDERQVGDKRCVSYWPSNKMLQTITEWEKREDGLSIMLRGVLVPLRKRRPDGADGKGQQKKSP